MECYESPCVSIHIYNVIMLNFHILNRPNILTLPSFTYATLFLFILECPFNKIEILLQWAVKSFEKSYELIRANDMSFHETVPLK